MSNGIIVKGIGGFYYVKVNDKIYECKARGRFRKQNIVPTVGDNVAIDILGDSNGVIKEIYKRESLLLRPSVANINQVIIVFALASPDPNLYLLDKFIVSAEEQGLDIIICFNKMDIVDNTKVEELKDIYKDTGYKLIFTSVVNDKGIGELRKVLSNKISAFAGPSGVGKSSLLNTVQPNFELKTGEISEKNERGKHTTRHVELLELNSGGYILDTPGFTSLDLNTSEEELQYLFPEFKTFLDCCKYKGCNHINEPECAVKNGVENNKISLSRYNSYVNIIKELRQRRRY